MPQTTASTRTNLITISFLALCTIINPESALGGIILSLNQDGGSSVNTGTAGPGKTISLYISEDATANDSLLASVPMFQLQSGVVTSGVIGRTGAVASPKYFGEGNLSTSQFVLDSASQFQLNQDFTDGMQLIPNDPVRSLWAEIVLDTTGLAEGTYAINLVNPSTGFRGPTFNQIPATNNLSFTVSAVPEPSSLSTLGLVLSSLLLRPRRRKPQAC